MNCPRCADLARDLDINLHTARHAYQLLREQGVVLLRLGSRAPDCIIAGSAGGPHRDREESRPPIAGTGDRCVSPRHTHQSKFLKLVNEAITQNERKGKSMRFKLHYPLWTHLPALACIRDKCGIASLRPVAGASAG